MLFKSLKLYSFGFALLILVAATTLAIFLVLNISFLYMFHLKIFHLELFKQYTSSTIHSTYKSVIYYLQSPFVNHMDVHPFSLSYQGNIHFRDVKRLILFNNSLMGLTILLFYRLYFKLYKRKQRWMIIESLRRINLIIYLFLVFCLADFKSAFISFHKLFFSNNYWIFNLKNDSLIKILPIDFFAQSFLIIVLFILIVNHVFIRLGKIDLKK
ncbi:TIGR01906 family membrane protein [Apilactobacillus xinyiensis]|uniref:TIGR01906 family membrane protein n=1 Tax=Apilactobacillus xinyiensis TaxID=2841032 RepID=UPI003364ECB8